MGMDIILDQEELGPTIFDYLKDDSIEYLLMYLPFKDRVKCERVSKKIRDLTMKVNATMQMTLSVVGEMVNQKGLIQNFCTHPRHRIWKDTCVIERTPWMTDILSILKKVPSLKGLHLRADDYAQILRHEESEGIGKLLPDIEHFSLIDDMLGVNIFNDALKIIQNMPNLFHLEVSSHLKPHDLI